MNAQAHQILNLLNEEAQARQMHEERKGELQEKENLMSELSQEIGSLKKKMIKLVKKQEESEAENEDLQRRYNQLLFDKSKPENPTCHPHDEEEEVEESDSEKMVWPPPSKPADKDPQVKADPSKGASQYGADGFQKFFRGGDLPSGNMPGFSHSAFTPKKRNISPVLARDSPDVQKKKIEEAESIKFQEFPNAAKLRSWKLLFQKKVSASSGRPKLALKWISQIDLATCMEDLEESEGSIWETLDAKIAAGLSEILHGEFQRKINILEERLAMEGRLLGGRQLAWLILQNFKLTEQEGLVLTFAQLIEVQLEGDTWQSSRMIGI